jgi:FkbM family methyltransferase
VSTATKSVQQNKLARKLYMHVAYLTSVHLDEPSAPSHHVLNTCKALIELDQPVTLIHPTPQISKLWAKAGIRSKPLLYPRVRGGWRMFELAAAWQLRKLVSKQPPDLVYLRFTPSRILNRILSDMGIPKVLELNGTEILDAQPFRGLAAAVDLILVDTEQMEVIVRTKFPEYAYKVQIHKSPGVDTSHFFSRPKLVCRQKLGLPEAPKILLHVSGFQPHHDFATLLRAAEILCDTHDDFLLVLLGSGPQWGAVKRMVSNLQCFERVIMPGAVSMEELPTYINAADICLNAVMTKPLRDGNFRATKLFEYLACDRPVIATVRPDVPIPDWAFRTLTMITPEDPAALAAAIKDIRMHPEDYSLRTAAGRGWVENNLSWRAATRTTLACLQNLTSGTGNRKSVVHSLVIRGAKAKLRYVHRQVPYKLYRTRIVNHSFGGHRFAIELPDRTAESWYDRDWEVLPELGLLTRLKVGATVFNLGAHHGVVAMMLAKSVGPNGTIVAIEGSSRNAQAARRNFTLNAITNCTVIHAIAGGNPGRLPFDAFGNGRVVSVGNKALGTEIVDCVSVDGLAAVYGRPDVLYMDVEGFECHVLRGSQSTLASRPDLFIEVHRCAGLEDQGGSVEELVSMIPNDYQLYVAEHDETKYASGHVFRHWTGAITDFHREAPTRRFFLVAVHPHSPIAAGDTCQ